MSKQNEHVLTIDSLMLNMKGDEGGSPLLNGCDWEGEGECSQVRLSLEVEDEA